MVGKVGGESLALFSGDSYTIPYNLTNQTSEGQDEMTIKTAKQVTEILAECKTVADINKSLRAIYQHLDECRLSRESVKFYGQCRKQEILMKTDQKG